MYFEQAIKQIIKMGLKSVHETSKKKKNINNHIAQLAAK